MTYTAQNDSSCIIPVVLHSSEWMVCPDHDGFMFSSVHLKLVGVRNGEFIWWKSGP